MSARYTIPFLERQSYRRRRLIDTIRMLPVIGAILWAVPLLWVSEGEADVRPEEVVSTSDAIVYIFLVWIALVIFGAWFARVMKRSDALEEEGGH